MHEGVSHFLLLAMSERCLPDTIKAMLATVELQMRDVMSAMCYALFCSPSLASEREKPIQGPQS